MPMNNPFLAADRNVPIGTFVSSAVLDFSASSANSFADHGQIWHNLQADFNPADADPQSAAPIYMGATGQPHTGEPAFVGLAGHKGSHFLFNGAEYLAFSGWTDHDPLVATVDGCWKNIHKTTGAQDFTKVFAIRFIHKAGNQCLFSTKCSGATDIGLVGYITSADKVSVTQRGNSANVTVTSAHALTTDTIYTIFISHTGNTTKLDIYDKTGTNLTRETAAHTFNTTTADPTGSMVYGVQFDITRAAGTAYLASGTEIYSIMGFSSALSNGNMDIVAAKISAREFA